MLHIHFGAGRLGLGLVAPFFQTDSSELHLVNRSVSASKPTGETTLTSERRNELLLGNPRRSYFIRTPGGAPGVPQEVRYDRFHTYAGNEDLASSIASILEASPGK